MSKRILFVLIACMTALCFSPLAFGQAVGSFSGTVTDKTGSSIAGASVTVTSQGTGVTRDAKTDETGHFIVNYVPIGMYTIRVQFQGFQPAEAKDLRLQIDESRELDFSLSPASVSSTVEVSATAVAVEALPARLRKPIRIASSTAAPAAKFRPAALSLSRSVDPAQTLPTGSSTATTITNSLLAASQFSPPSIPFRSSRSLLTTTPRSTASARDLPSSSPPSPEATISTARSSNFSATSLLTPRASSQKHRKSST